MTEIWCDKCGMRMTVGNGKVESHIDGGYRILFNRDICERCGKELFHIIEEYLNGEERDER